MAMGDSGCSFSMSNLVCDEDSTLLVHDDDDEEEEEKKSEKLLLLKDSEEAEDEYIEILVSKEASFDGTSVQPFSGNHLSVFTAGDWLKCARSDAIQWILRTKACFRFSIQTAFLAVTYLDRFLAGRPIEDEKCWAVKLSAVACLSLAAKMEEHRVPGLSEFRLEDYQFHRDIIQRMELLILNTLEWRMSSVTPFAYLSYFASKFQFECNAKKFLYRAVAIIFATIEVMNLANYRPSAIAAAAILSASSQRLTKKSVESKMSPISSCASLLSEHVFSCYTMMVQEAHKVGLKASNTSISTDLRMMNPTNDSNDFDGADSTSITATSSKRRRLQ